MNEVCTGFQKKKKKKMQYYVLGDGAWLNFKVVKMQYITSGAWLRVSAPFQLIVLGIV